MNTGKLDIPGLNQAVLGILDQNYRFQKAVIGSKDNGEIHTFNDKNGLFIPHTLYSFDEDNKDTFLFGSFLFDQFITEFDYEEKTVNLYSQIVLETYSNNTMKKSLLIVIDIIMISCVAGLIYAVKKRKAPKMIVNDFI